MKKNIFNYGLIILFVLSLSACGTTKPSMMESGMSQADLENQWAEAKNREAEAAKLKSSLAIQEQQVEQRKTQLAEEIAAAKDAQLKARTAEENAKMGMQASPSDESLLPPNAKAGECYARIFVPNTYKKVTETVLRHAASERIETSPPKYQTVEETKVAKEASEKLEVVPATYGWMTEEVMVTPASYNLVEVPATYETVTEKILVREAHLEWKKGSGPIQKINEATGEIMCLVEEPALYKNVSKRILKTAATTTKVEIPATYKTVKRRVMKTPPTTRVITIPAEYQTVKVTKLVQPAMEKRIEIPAQYQTVTKKIKVSDGHMEWRGILCETNMTRSKISDIQKALKVAGYDPGPIDGVIGSATMKAVNSFQKEKGLVVSKYLTMNTLEALGVVGK